MVLDLLAVKARLERRICKPYCAVRVLYPISISTIVRVTTTPWNLLRSLRRPLEVTTSSITNLITHQLSSDVC